MVAIRPAVTSSDLQEAARLIAEYTAWLGVDLGFQNLDDELATLPGAYAPPRGRLLLAGSLPAVGCIALRPLDDTVGEVKRLYVLPGARATGLARRLAGALLTEAHEAGYRTLMLDTLGWMRAARGLYASLGFRECAPYYQNPLPDVVYMTLDLHDR